jgi:hypothetical protein
MRRGGVWRVVNTVTCECNLHDADLPPLHGVMRYMTQDVADREYGSSLLMVLRHAVVLTTTRVACPRTRCCCLHCLKHAYACLSKSHFEINRGVLEKHVRLR